MKTDYERRHEEALRALRDIRIDGDLERDAWRWCLAIAMAVAAALGYAAGAVWGW